MSDDPGSGNLGTDSVALEEWVERTAENKNKSPEAVIDRLISSYWILDELNRMATDPEFDDKGEVNTQKRADVSTEDIDSEEVDTEELADIVKNIKHIQETTGEESDTDLTESRQESETSKNDRSPSVSAETPIDFLTVVLDLRDQIDEISEELDEVRDQHETASDEIDSELEETITDIESTVADAVTNSEFEVLINELDKEFEKVERSIDQIEGRISQLEESQKESINVRRGLKQSHGELENRIEREFDSIEAVLRNVLDTSDDLEYRIGSVAESHQEDVEPLQEYTESQQRLAELKQEAQREGVSKGVCDYCEEEIDLRLLEEPYCHNCRHLLTGIAETSWLPFQNPKLQTNSIQKDLDDSTKEKFDDKAPEDHSPTLSK